MATNIVTANIDVLSPLGVNNEFRSNPRESSSLFDPAQTNASNAYYLMEAYDTAALAWKQWVARGAPDLTAAQYPGTAFPFTQVFVLRAWRT